jgi:integrase
MDAMRSRPYLDPASARKTFAEVVDSWMSSRKKIRDSTRHRDERDLATWVLPKWGNREIGSIARAEVIAWITELEVGSAPHQYAARAAGKVALGLSPRSIRGLYVILNGALNYAVDLRWLAYNEAQGVELAASDESRRIYLNFEKLESLAVRIGRTSGRVSDETLIRLLGYTGLRIGEALALKVSDVDLVSDRILVERTWTDSN